ncbi:MAG: hypothetical protein M0Z62_00620 [Actinomycetota bacterium]|nr:hypothetical protein [Actinomycetota bacterium]
MTVLHRDDPTSPESTDTTDLSRIGRRARMGVAGNSRLTSSTAAVLLVLLAAEGATLLRIHSLLSWHVFIGFLLVPPIALKMASTSYRFARYYLGSPAYRRKGPPPPLLRLLGPFVIALTVILIASGIALVFVGPSLRGEVLFVHKASFVLWFGAMAIHVLGHILETARLAPRDWLRHTRANVAGATARQWLVVGSVALGLPLAFMFVGRAANWWTVPLH